MAQQWPIEIASALPNEAIDKTGNRACNRILHALEGRGVKGLVDQCAMECVNGWINNDQRVDGHKAMFFKHGIDFLLLLRLLDQQKSSHAGKCLWIGRNVPYLVIPEDHVHPAGFVEIDRALFTQ
ncbi:MAG: hypothetical protein IPI83_14640 [Sphingomonadales bacterium]|nr:hypothetical protein [Sphingomonadales bacterium]